MHSTGLQLVRAIVLICVSVHYSRAAENPPLNDGRAGPEANRSGPWQNDVLIYRTGAGTKIEQLARFPRAGVSTMARLKDGRVAAANQHFPENNREDFDKVAVRFSSDEGRTWTDPEVIRLQGLPDGMRFPFDPTLVPLPDGRVRLYFTSLKGRRFEQDRPAIYSAISSNCLEFVFEPGVRFGIQGRPVIDCAVALHNGVFHLFSPDNGTAMNPGARDIPPEEQGREGVGYYATSKDGLSFTRQSDVQIEGGRRWLGAAVSDGPHIRFFGTGEGGMWVAASTNGQSWVLDQTFSARGADPGVVKLKDGGWLISATGPRQDGSRQNAGPGGNPRPPLLSTLDVNGDGTLDQREIEDASMHLLKLDRNGDGRLTPDETRGGFPERGRPPSGFPPPARE